MWVVAPPQGVRVAAMRGKPRTRPCSLSPGPASERLGEAFGVRAVDTCAGTGAASCPLCTRRESRPRPLRPTHDGRVRVAPPPRKRGGEASPHALGEVSPRSPTSAEASGSGPEGWGFESLRGYEASSPRSLVVTARRNGQRGAPSPSPEGARSTRKRVHGHARSTHVEGAQPPGARLPGHMVFARPASSR